MTGEEKLTTDNRGFGGRTILSVWLCASALALTDRIVRPPQPASQASQLLLEKPPFCLLLAECERPFIRGAGLVETAEAAAEIGAGGVGELIVGQFAAGQDGVDEGQAGQRPGAHGHGRGAGQLDHGWGN